MKKNKPNKNKLWLLLKMQYKSIMRFSGSDERAKKQREKAEKDGTSIAKKKDAGAIGYVVMMVVVGVIMLAVLTGMCFLMGIMLQPMGLLKLILAAMMVSASLMALFTTIYKTNGVLFGFKDYDLLMSLPVKTSTVIASRLMILYFMNLIFTMLIMIPGIIVYAVLGSPPIAFWPVIVVCTLLIPLVPVILATIIGSFISWAASHFKRKSGMNVVFTVAALMLWMFFCMNMTNVAEGFVAFGESIMNTVYGIYPLALFFVQAVADLNMLSLLFFALISIGAFSVFAVVLGKFFVRLNSTITANRTKSNYKMQELKTASPTRALFKKELKRFTGSSNYMMNSGIGLILMTVAAVVVLVIGPVQMASFLGYGEIYEMIGLGDRLAMIAAMGMSFFAVMTCPTCCSVSLEGSSLWILKSMPISTKDILKSKINMNVALIAVFVLINGTLLNIALKPDFLGVIFMYITPLLYGAFAALFGMVLNLAHPNFKWENEIEVMKRGKPVTIATFVGMFIVFVPAFAVIFLGGMVLYPMAAVLAIACLLMYRNIMTKGAEKFDSFQA